MKTDTKKKRKTAGRSRGPKAINEEFRAIFMKNILDKKEELERILQRLIDSQKEYDVQQRDREFIDELDQAQREISASSSYPIIERKIKELKKIETLIGRISKDEKFGLCEECGKRIPTERLLIVPEASLCVACQRESEKMDLYKRPRARDLAAMGRVKETDLEESDESDASSFIVLRTHAEAFTLNDLPEAGLENDFAGEGKGH